MPLDGMASLPGGLDEFRLTAAREIASMLRQLLDGSVRLNLNGSDGCALAVTVWAIDAERDSLSFSVDGQDPTLQALLECEEAVVVGYMESVKLQFDIRNLVLVHGPRASVLRCSYPREVFRFQRRGTFRVRPLPRSSPITRRKSPCEVTTTQARPAQTVLSVSAIVCRFSIRWVSWPMNWPAACSASEPRDPCSPNASFPVSMSPMVVWSGAPTSSN